MRLPGAGSDEPWFPTGDDLLYVAWHYSEQGAHTTALLTMPIHSDGAPVLLDGDTDIAVYDRGLFQPWAR